MPTAVVTGAAIRVGRAIAIAMAREGHDVHLCAHSSSDKLEAVKAEVEALGQQAWTHTADLSDAAAVDALAVAIATQTPTLDVLVHSAGVFWATPFADVTREEVRKTHAINFDAPYFLTQGLLGALRAAPSPLIINITDILGDRPVARYSHYVTSKAALISLTRALAVELAPHIRVNALSPGTVAFPPDMSETECAAIRRSIPFGEEGTVEDMADAAVGLLRMSYVSGQVLAVDGARSAKL